MVQTNNTDKLEQLLRPHREAVNVLQEALREVSKEDADKRKDSAKDLVRKALSLQNEMNAAERQFNGAKKKFDKELGKVIQRLTNMANNRPLDEGVKDEKDEKDDDESSE